MADVRTSRKWRAPPPPVDAAQHTLPTREQNRAISLPTQLRSWWSSVKARSERRPVLLRCDEFALTQTSGVDANEQRVRLAWEQITSVYAYKRDCVTMDQIRLIIGNDELKLWIEASEDDVGFGEVVSQLPHHLLGCPSIDNWLQTVALPPFETQWTTLYRREARSEGRD